VGAKGDPGKDSKDGEDGKSAYELWLEDGNEGTKRDYLRSLKGLQGIQGFPGYPGGGGARGPAGPPGPSHEHVPQSATLTRDGNGAVQSVTVEGESAWVISRNPDGSVASLTNGDHDVAVDRDEDDAIEGVTSTEL
jgi:hypothetical protein